MLRPLVNICMVLMLGLASPTASVVRLSCADTGSTTVTLCTLESECASDPCCPDNTGGVALQSNCCRTDVFSLTSTSPVPAAPVAHALPVFICTLSPESTAMPVAHVEASVPAVPLGRNLPLLV